jgi:hypothetical protein
MSIAITVWKGRWGFQVGVNRILPLQLHNWVVAYARLCRKQYAIVYDVEALVQTPLACLG